MVPLFQDQGSPSIPFPVRYRSRCSDIPQHNLAETLSAMLPNRRNTVGMASLRSTGWETA